MSSRIADIKNRFCRRIEKSLVQAKFPGTRFVWTVHIPVNIIIATVIATIRIRYATHHECSQFFHTYLQRNINSSRDGKFPDYKVNIFGRTKLIAVCFKPSDRRNARNVLSKSER